VAAMALVTRTGKQCIQYYVDWQPVAYEAKSDRH